MSDLNRDSTLGRVLVTGAAGFIGSHLCKRFVSEGYHVIGLDDLSEGSIENLRMVPEVDLVIGDLRDPAVVSRAARGCRAILHQGAKRSVPRSMREPILTTEVNVGGTLNVLLAARKEGAVLVSASSSSVYGDQEIYPLREDMETRPCSPYAASKLAAEAYCAAMWRASSIRCVSLRYFNAYGPGQDPASEYAAVVPRFTQACLTGTRPVIFGDGEQARDFTFIDDVVEANLLAVRAPEAAFGSAFNIGGGADPTSINELLEIIAGFCDSDPDPVWEPPREGDVRLTEADISRAAELLGYRPAVSILEGLKRTVDAFRKKGEIARLVV